MTARLRAACDRSAWLAVVLALVLPVWLLASSAAEHDWDPTTWIVAGDAPVVAADRVPAGAVRVAGTGYDGQFYLALARDPLALDAATRAALDTPAYRAQRVLLPAVAWAASGGGRVGALPWAIPALNLLGVALVALAVARLARRAGNPAWVGTAAAMVTGLVLAVLRDLAEPLALGLLAMGLLARTATGRWAPAAWGALAAAACLGRESLALVVAAMLVTDLVRRRWPLAAGGAAALAVAGAWQLVVRLHLGAFGVTSSGPGTWGAPFRAPLAHLRDLADAGVLWQARGLWTLVFVLATVAGVAWALWVAWRERSDLALALTALAATAVVYGPALWGDVFAYTRNLAALWLIAVAVAAGARAMPFRLALPAASIVLTLGFWVAGGIPRVPL